MTSVITVENLRKRYGDVLAVDGISFDVREGEIFGMVGPNGAGKTTTIECIEGLRSPTSGKVRVLGLNPARQRGLVMERIGIQLQSSSLPPRLKVREIMDLFASFYPRTVDADELLERLGLAEKRNALYDKLSGGQKQRLFIALALLHDPDIIFLDELTTGLDPQARLQMWEMVESIRNQGKTIFLTTHYMEEAERLCDRVAILDRGRLVALDSPANLVRQLNTPLRIVFEPLTPVDVTQLKRLPAVDRVDTNGRGIIIYGREEHALVDVVQALAAQRVRFANLHTEQPTLEDVYLALTNRERSPHHTTTEVL